MKGSPSRRGQSHRHAHPFARGHNSGVTNVAIDSIYDFTEEKIQVKKGVSRGDLIKLAVLVWDEWYSAP